MYGRRKKKKKLKGKMEGRLGYSCDGGDVGECFFFGTRGILFYVP